MLVLSQIQKVQSKKTDLISIIPSEGYNFNIESEYDDIRYKKSF